MKRGAIRNPPASLTVSLLIVSASLLRAAEPHILQIDFARTNGVIHALHGINKGPLAPGGLVDVTEAQRALTLPFTRLHDCHWPNPDVVDIHAVFPDFRADPDDPKSYSFALTDEYLAAIQQTGASIIYRLGESIEHTKIKRFVHPPAEPGKWAAICLGVIRHYNEGWANGFRHDIRYWEIWNEPENRPAMWTGTDSDYFRLYQASTRAIKSRHPSLKVGGPAVGHSGDFVKGQFRPSAFVTNFLAFCRRESLPLNFFSWHCYTDDPAELSIRAKAIRQLLDAYGFRATESHLNEWNYLPGHSWKALSKTADPEERRRFYDEMSGAAGAAFVAAALLELQDAPVNIANFFHGELGGFGLFTEHGVPTRIYDAMMAFRRLLETPRRVEVRGGDSGRLAVVAGVDATNRRAAVLVSSLGHPASEFRFELLRLPWRGASTVEIQFVDTTRRLNGSVQRTNLTSDASLDLSLIKPGIALITLRSALP